jgi:class 3 adenylate cyclase
VVIRGHWHSSRLEPSAGESHTASMVRRGHKRRLTTLLFTDIVGSTDIAAELGDDRWRRLLSDQRSLVRREVRRFGGQLIDSSGDSVFATFEEPIEAVRCACAVLGAVRRLGLELRAGLHLGEAEREGGRVGGIAVHTAARVAAAAAAGEVLVTSTIVDVVAGSGVVFTDRGMHVLKGVPGQWHLFDVAAVDQVSLQPPVDAAEASQIRDRVVPPAQSTRRRLSLYVALASAIALVLLIGLVVASADQSGPGSGPSASAGPNKPLLAKISAGAQQATRIDGVFPPNTSQAGPITVVQGHVWLASSDSIEPISATYLTKVRPRDGVRVSTARYEWGCHAESPCVAAARGLVWMTAVVSTAATRPRLLVGAVDPNTNGMRYGPRSFREEGRVSFGSIQQIAGLVYGAGSLWTAVAGDHTLYRIDLHGSQPGLPRPIGVTGEIDGLAYGERAVWIIDRINGTLTKVDPVTGSAGSSAPLSGSPSSVAAGNGYVWVTDVTNGELLRVDPSLEQSFAPIDVGRRPIAVTVGGGHVWVANFSDGTVSEVDPTSGTVVQTIPVAAGVRGVAYGDGALWVATGSLGGG